MITCTINMFSKHFKSFRKIIFCHVDISAAL